MKTKIIPFDAETARKIQAGEVEGRILTRERDFTARIICFDKVKLVNDDGTTENQIVSLIYNNIAREDVLYIHNQKGVAQTVFNWEHGYDLVLEVPEAKVQFNVGDKVRIRPNSTRGRFVRDYDGCIGEVVEARYDFFVVIVTGAFQTQLSADELELVEGEEFEPFSKVLVRDYDESEWNADFYSHFKNGIYKCVSCGWKQCIPYEGNEHLIGTRNKPKED